MPGPRIAILISGTGSNMEAIIAACRHGSLVADTVIVISDNPDAAGLRKAKSKGVKTLAAPYEKNVPREDNEARIIAAMKPVSHVPAYPVANPYTGIPGFGLPFGV